MRGADLGWMNLRGRDLRGANFSRANFEGADLRDCKLMGCNLSGANLHRAKLDGADMSFAVLRRSFAAFVAFKNVSLRSCDITEADLSGATFDGATFGDDDESRFFMAKFCVVPDGEIFGWKKLRNGKIAKLMNRPDGDDDDRALLVEVHNAVPKHLPDWLRADICQDLIVGILAGEIERAALGGSVKAYTRKVLEMHPLKYGPLSLDANIPGTDIPYINVLTNESYRARLGW